MFTQHDSSNWQHILWREWRNCGNGAYATQLFELLADAPVGWGTKTIYILLDAIVGLVLGVLFGFIWTTNWNFLQQLAWAGSVIGAARGFLAVRDLTWRHWLERLSFSLPTKQPSAGLAALFGLMLIGSIILGPFLWLFIIGLFWSMSGLLKWMMQGLTRANPFSYHAWYFWWWGRPPTNDVEAALQRAAETERPTPAENEITPPGYPSPPPVEIDFLQLKQYARRREMPPS